MSSPIVVRFAPSPTGYLHVGGARTAIFNWLYARSQNGRFLLRIEDTDRARSSDEMTREILNGLRWLGVDWDNTPWIQSAQIERHRAECLRLHAEGTAYWCYCTPEELAAKRGGAENRDTKYDRSCLRLGDEERAAKEAAGLPRVLRFRVPEGITEFYDIVHEETAFQNEEIDDFVILRSDGSPVYMIAVVVDDHDMGVTQVLRGDDHLSNTPKQILLYNALGYAVPMFGHMPLILGEDKKRLSKRHGATAVGEYQTRGILPEALFNFLALLGWSPGEDREIMSRDEMVESFDARRLLKKSSVFDEKKLAWMNGQHIRMLGDAELLDRLRPWRPATRASVSDEYLLQVLALMKERIELLADFFEKAVYFFEDPTHYDDAGVLKHWKPGIPELLRALAAEFASCSFEAPVLEDLVRRKAEEESLSAGKLIHPLRLALTGGTQSPSLFDMMVVLGRETCLRRIEIAVRSNE
jgi:glutamyl-tRNA synthetase